MNCIYIDPPYNTGEQGWVYNDNVNSPEIKAWLGSVVSKEAEDLCRHDNWLCMIYPRLRLLRDFLEQGGAIFVSIDDEEVVNLRTSVDKFYPDFVCELQDGRVLVIEYKGALLAHDPAEQQKRLIGEL